MSKKVTEKKLNKTEDEKNKKSVKSKEHTVIVDTAETVKQIDDDLTNRINMLYGESSGSMQSEKQYDPKEIEEVRKKLILLLIGLVIFSVVLIIVIINPFDFGNNNNITEENVEKQEEKEEGIPLGVIDASDPTVVKLNEFVSFSVNDFMAIDLFPLYVNDSLEVNNLPNSIKLFLFKKSESFNKMLSEANVEQYVKTCDANGIIIPKKSFDNAFSKTFGPNVIVSYEPINVSYSSKDIESKKITMSYVENGYLLTCNEYVDGSVITQFVQQSLNKAVKEEQAIEIYQNVVFINQTGVYKDSNFTQLITNDINASFDDYISSGSLYKYTFTEDGENYYLTKIEKVIETNQ